MTLVIAQKTDNGLLSLSDTKITFDDSRKENPYFGALKSHIISPHIAFHFAGNVYWAEKALEIIRDKHKTSSHLKLDELVGLAYKKHQESNEETDFLLMDGQSNSIIKISAGAILNNCEKAYIGDNEGYKIFIDYYSLEEENLRRNRTPDKYLTFCALGLAFKRTTTDEKANSVEGFDVSIFQKDIYLGYQQKVEVNAGPMKLKIGKEPTKLPFGSVINGSFSTNFLSPEPGESPQALGVHMFFGKIGILWGPGHYIRPIVIQDCTHEKLTACSKEIFGATLRGIQIS